MIHKIGLFHHTPLFLYANLHTILLLCAVPCIPFFPDYSFSFSSVPSFIHPFILFFPIPSFSFSHTLSFIYLVLLQFLLSFCNPKIFHHTLLLSLLTDPPTPVRLKLCPPGVCRAAETGRRQAPWRTRSTARLSSTSSQLSMLPSTPTTTSATPRHRSSPGSRRLRCVVVWWPVSFVCSFLLVSTALYMVA